MRSEVPPRAARRAVLLLVHRARARLSLRHPFAGHRVLPGAHGAHGAHAAGLHPRSLCPERKSVSLPRQYLRRVASRREYEPCPRWRCASPPALPDAVGSGLAEPPARLPRVFRFLLATGYSRIRFVRLNQDVLESLSNVVREIIGLSDVLLEFEARKRSSQDNFFSNQWWAYGSVLNASTSTYPDRR